MQLSNKLFLGLSGTLVGALVLLGCQGSTSGGDDNGSGSVFVPDSSSVGTIRLAVVSNQLSVGETTGFRVYVNDAKGNPVEGIKISCDTELNVALLEPSTGTEITSGSGEISGRLGCEDTGSYQVACRLPIGGGNLRDFETILCSGSRPPGFSGFPGAGGGGLGGNTGGTGNNSNLVQLTSVVINDGGQTTRNVDLAREGDCDGDNTTNDPETFSDANITFTVKNSTNSTLTIESYRFSVPALGYTSDRISLQGSTLVVSPAASADFGSIFAYQGDCIDAFTSAAACKYFAGGATQITAATGDVDFTVTGEFSDGTPVTLTGSTTLSFNDFSRCTAS